MLVKYDERTYPGIVSGSGGDAASEGGSGYVVVGSRPGANDLETLLSMLVTWISTQSSADLLACAATADVSWYSAAVMNACCCAARETT